MQNFFDTMAKWLERNGYKYTEADRSFAHVDMQEDHVTKPEIKNTDDGRFSKLEVD